jgi:hypothetical protein
MPLHNVGPRDLPTAEDAAYWRAEREAYIYQAPNPHAPQDSPEFRGWGIPPHRAAPPDALDWVIGKYREDDLDLYHHDPRDKDNYVPLHPKFAWALAAATMAHFAWFRTAPGARWINRFFGVQEIAPFFEGYAYFWVDPSSPNADPPQLTGNLRIFRQWERCVEPPCPGVGSQRDGKPFDQMVKLLESYRSPYASEPGEHMEEVFSWVSLRIRDWFLEPRAEDRWPFYKKGRISGAEWIKQQQRSDGTPFYEAIDRIVRYHRAAYANQSPGPVRAYRFEDQRGNVYWCAGNEIRVVPLIDVHKVFRHDMNEKQLAEVFSCRGCRRTRSCVPYTKRDHLCCNCYAREIEQGTSMPTLDKCTMLPECKACPDRIDSNAGLVSLKQRWNRAPRTGPIPR